MADKGSTIIIKKIKKGGHGHHGGAWKVAYADFVTAMMAFFLLMWLLTATPVENLEGLADYFSPTVGLEGKMGIGFAGGKSPNTEGMSRGDWASQGLIFGAPPSGPILKVPEKDNKADEVENTVNFDLVQKDLTDSIAKSTTLHEFEENINIETTIDGININIVDNKKRSMFEEGKKDLKEHTKVILTKITDIIKDIPNYIQIVGHTTEINKLSSEEYSNWELSADRANEARRYMVKSGLDTQQVARIVGKADTELANREDRNAPENSRISITLLRKSVIALHKQPAPDEVMLGPEESGLKSYVKDNKLENEKLEPVTKEVPTDTKENNSDKSKSKPASKKH